MKLTTRRAAIMASAAVIVGLSGPALARPVHHQHHSYHYQLRHQHVVHHRHLKERAHASNSFSAVSTNSESDQRRGFQQQEWTRRNTENQGAEPRRVAERPRIRKTRRARVERAPGAVPALSGGSSLVASARSYIGTNPTGRRSLWCGAFMDKVLRDSGYPGGGNLALGYLRYGHRISGPQVGAIAVMGRRHGGHVGVVSGVDPNGNPIVISGNHNRTVAESVYPRGRIIAYVMPGK